MIKGLLFDTAKATIKKDSYSLLDQAAAYMKESGESFEGQGHTDAQGSEAYNLKLSDARAKACLLYSSRCV